MTSDARSPASSPPSPAPASAAQSQGAHDQGARAQGAQPDIERLVARIPALAGAPRTIAELPGGLTNRNYVVTTPAGRFVVRAWSDGGALAIDREHEYRNSLIAAAAGVGAPVIDYRPRDQVLVLGFLHGRTYGNDDLTAPGNLSRVAAAVARLHRAGRFVGDFDMFDVQRRYRAVAAAGRMRVPAGYDDLAPAFEQARRALAAAPPPTVPCHNDLLAANFIDDGSRIALIDYEYAGNNDPYFELGNIAGECGLSADALAELVTAYDAAARPAGRPAMRSAIARAELFRLVSRHGWTLWGVIQHATSPLDVDFWSWAMERHEIAAAGLTGPDFACLTDAVAERD